MAGLPPHSSRRPPDATRLLDSLRPRPAPGIRRPSRQIAVRAGRLIDGADSAPIRNAVILIEGDRITAVGAGLAIPAGYEVVDLSRSTVLPGLIDCHTHI